MKKRTVRKKKYSYKGTAGAGMLYIVFAILVITAGAAVLIGNITPSVSPTGYQPVVITGPQSESSKNNLQLYTFPAAIYTPTPSPTPSPTPTETPIPNPGPGDGGSYSCFPAGTKILMANGTEKNIEEVKTGDKVKGYNGKTNVTETVLATESPIRDHLYKLSLQDGTTLSLTREHPLFTQNGWSSISPESTLQENPNLHVHKINIGDKVLKANGKYIKITDIKYIPGNVQTYNLKTVTGYNDFYANDILAHNKGGGGAPPACCVN